jgi:Helix-turn-helix domain
MTQPVIPADIKPAMFSVADAVRYSGFSRSGIYVLAKSGKLTILKFGKRSFILRANLDAVIRSLTIAPFPR